MPSNQPGRVLPIRLSPREATGPDGPTRQITVMVAADELSIRILLAEIFGDDPDSRVIRSDSIDEILDHEPRVTPTIIVAVAVTEADYGRIARLARRFPDAVSIAFTADPSPLEAEAMAHMVVPVTTLADRPTLFEKLEQLFAERRPPTVEAAAIQAEEEAQLASLTGRERQVLQLTAEGLSMKQIATRLHRAYGTIASHREAIRRKTGLNDVATLTRFAVRHALLDA
jgi:DNA-binding NarL/FixJ family response regulator